MLLLVKEEEDLTCGTFFCKRERALGSTTTKLFENDNFQRNDYISTRFLIVESSATTRLSLLLRMRARIKKKHLPTLLQ